jgi:hypothetical protein
LINLGVDPDTIFDPRIEDGEWRPDFHIPHERYQKFNADSVLFYIGDPGDGMPSAYSSFEIMPVALKRDPESTAVILDSRNLSTHGAKQIRAIRSDLSQMVPGVHITGSVGEGLSWVVKRLGLEKRLGEYALERTASSIDGEHISATTPPGRLTTNSAHKTLEKSVIE